MATAAKLAADQQPGGRAADPSGSPRGVRAASSAAAWKSELMAPASVSVWFIPTQYPESVLAELSATLDAEEQRKAGEITDAGRWDEFGVRAIWTTWTPPRN